MKKALQKCLGRWRTWKCKGNSIVSHHTSSFAVKRFLLNLSRHLKIFQSVPKTSDTETSIWSMSFVLYHKNPSLSITFLFQNSYFHMSKASIVVFSPQSSQSDLLWQTVNHGNIQATGLHHIILLAATLTASGEEKRRSGKKGHVETADRTCLWQILCTKYC